MALTDEQRLLRTVSEAAWQKQVEEMLAVCGFEPALTYHTHDSRRSRAGFPDVMALRRTGINWTVFVGELKTETGRVRPEQYDWLGAWQSLGAPVNVLCKGTVRIIAGVFRPSDAERLWDLLKEER